MSYARADSDFALKLGEALRSAGVNIWLDQLDIPTGERWDRVTEQALELCEHILVILSPASVISENVMDEVAFALEEKKQLLPILYSTCRIPFRIRRLQYIDFTKDFDKGLKHLLSTLKNDERDEPIAREASKDKSQKQQEGTELETGKNFTQKVGNTAFNMIFVKGGTFNMGSDDCESGENPLHEAFFEKKFQPPPVTLSDFYIAEFQVTQILWQVVMGTSVFVNPCEFKGENLPVEHVSWYDAVEFCNQLSGKTGKQPYYNIEKNKKDPNNKSDYDDVKWTVTINEDAKGYRLLTEAEWEYAARGGAQSKGYNYAGSNNIDEVAWYRENAKESTQPVGQKKANELGIYDMSGNVWEWCSDWFGDYSTRAQTDPKGPASGSDRVLRGGSWDYFARYCRSASRRSSDPGARSSGIGFRLVSPK